MISIREEKRQDVTAVRTVNERAFEQSEEADIVDRLRDSCDDLISLVAERDGRIVGHILFSPAAIESGGSVVRGMALGPMAVLPDHQRHGIGTAMVESGLVRLRDRSCPFVIVIGHPTYYPRFGFEAASGRGLTCSWEGVPDEAFMVLVLDEAAIEGATGVVRYRAEFGE